MTEYCNCVLHGRDVAIAFLSHPETWEKFMRVSVKKKVDHDRDLIVTPMRMLIEHMPSMVKCFYVTSTSFSCVCFCILCTCL